MSENKKVPWGVVVLAFLFGIAAGAAAMRMYFTHTIWTWDPAKRFTQKLDQTLDLTDAQRQQVGAVLSDQKVRMEELKGVWSVDVRLVARDGEDRLGQLLTPAQLDKFMKSHDDIHGWMTRFLWTADSSSTALAVTPKPAPKAVKP
jgi:hypothetical protein